MISKTTSKITIGINESLNKRASVEYYRRRTLLESEFKLTYFLIEKNDCTHERQVEEEASNHTEDKFA